MRTCNRQRMAVAMLAAFAMMAVDARAGTWVAGGSVRDGSPNSYTDYPIREKTYEACSHDKLRIQASGGDVVVRYAHASGVLRVPGADLTWFCGSSKERTGCPSGTTHVHVRRSQERRFTVFCLGGEITGTSTQP